MIAHYEERAAACASTRDVERRRSIRISRLRLAAFIPGAACIVWSMARGMPVAPLAAGIALLAAFVVLVVWHARVEERVAWYEALHAVNALAVARIGRAWDRMPPAETPSSGDRGSLFARATDDVQSSWAEIEHHPYALDLDLFGRASLMQWLGPAATAAGTETLHAWLLRPADPTDIRARQGAASSLAPAIDWREQLGAHGRLAAGVRRAELRQFLSWAEGPAPFSARAVRWLRATVPLLTASIWILIALDATGFTEASLWLIAIVIGIVLSFATAKQVHGEFNRAGASERAFTRYGDLLAHATAAPADAPYLRTLQSRLSASGSPAPLCMRRLNRILGFAKLRTGPAIFHFLIQALTLWDFYVFFALNTWRNDVGTAVRGWMLALGELDALSVFAQAKADNAAWCMPEIDEAAATLTATNLAHPLIHEARRVGNDVLVGPPGTLLLVTGSNMSGKSTLLRAIGVNTLLAQAGGPVCADAMRMPPVDLETSIRVQDSLEHGLSYFMAALARLKGVVDRSHHPRHGRLMMYLLDEILQGTNSMERAIAVRGVARHLLQAGAIGVMTTHDLTLASQEPLNTAARLVHFTELVDEHGRMTFDYRLRPGLASSRNALRLMHLIGIDLEEPSQSPSAVQPPASRQQGSN